MTARGEKTGTKAKSGEGQRRSIVLEEHYSRSPRRRRRRGGEREPGAKGGEAEEWGCWSGRTRTPLEGERPGGRRDDQACRRRLREIVRSAVSLLRGESSRRRDL